MKESPKVLDGVRILEVARWQAAPRGGLVLRAMGRLEDKKFKPVWSMAGSVKQEYNAWRRKASSHKMNCLCSLDWKNTYRQCVSFVLVSVVLVLVSVSVVA